MRRSSTKTSTRTASKAAYRPSANVRDNVLYARDPELIVSGPAGTGKSRGILEKIYLSLAKYPGSRWLMFRKVRASLTKTGIITFENHVLPPHLGIFRHSQKDSYEFPNGSVLDLAGMDNPEKIKSGEWDGAYGQEITECDEADFDMVSSRLRNGVMPYQMLIGDCNPSHPRHWAKVRCETPTQDDRAPAGTMKTRMVPTLHQDNPRLWDPIAQDWTEYGRQYILRLRNLQGVMRLRLYKGIWAAAEGMVYDQWDDDIHIVEAFNPPYDWKRIWAVDFGFTAPFVWHQYVLVPETYTTPSGRVLPAGSLVLHKEIYLSHVLVEDHAKMIKEHMDRPPTTFVADHDAEDRATLERHVLYNTHPAHKDISDGIQKVKERMRHDTRKSTLYVMDRTLVHPPDQFMLDKRLPTCLLEEIVAYVWDTTSKDSIITTRAGLKRAEQPKMVNDHGCDTLKYAVAQIDIVGVSDGVFF